MQKYGRDGKKENFARDAPRREEGDKGREGRGLPPVPPLIFENIGDDSYGFNSPPPPHTHTFWFEAGVTPNNDPCRIMTRHRGSLFYVEKWPAATLENV